MLSVLLSMSVGTSPVPLLYIVQLYHSTACIYVNCGSLGAFKGLDLFGYVNFLVLVW